jgi:hypothetical protein
MFKCWFALSLYVAFSQQDPTPAEAQAAAARAAAQAAAQAEQARQQELRQREALERSMKEFLGDTRETIAAAMDRKRAQLEASRKAQREALNNSYRDFQSARESLSEALGFKSALKVPAEKIRKSTGVFLDLMKRMNEKRATFDASEFKDFTPNELSWEALTTAERLAPELAAMIRAESSQTVDIRFLTSLSKLEVELLRLQWMTRRLK